MLYRVLADGIMLLHFAYIVFVIGGALLVLHRRWWMWLHLPAVAWGVWVEFYAKTCPLTPLENALRARAGQAGIRRGIHRSLHHAPRLPGWPHSARPSPARRLRGPRQCAAVLVGVAPHPGRGVTTLPYSRIDST